MPQLTFGFAVAVHTPLDRHAILTQSTRTRSKTTAELNSRPPPTPTAAPHDESFRVHASGSEGDEGGDVHAISDGDDGGAAGGGAGRGVAPEDTAARAAGRYFARRR